MIKGSVEAYNSVEHNTLTESRYDKILKALREGGPSDRTKYYIKKYSLRLAQDADGNHRLVGRQPATGLRQQSEEKEALCAGNVCDRFWSKLWEHVVSNGGHITADDARKIAKDFLFCPSLYVDLSWGAFKPALKAAYKASTADAKQQQRLLAAAGSGGGAAAAAAEETEPVPAGGDALEHAEGSGATSNECRDIERDDASSVPAGAGVPAATNIHTADAAGAAAGSFLLQDAAAAAVDEALTPANRRQAAAAAAGAGSLASGAHLGGPPAAAAAGDGGADDTGFCMPPDGMEFLPNFEYQVLPGRLDCRHKDVWVFRAEAVNCRGKPPLLVYIVRTAKFSMLGDILDRLCPRSRGHQKTHAKVDDLVAVYGPARIPRTDFLMLGRDFHSNTFEQATNGNEKIVIEEMFFELVKETAQLHKCGLIDPSMRHTNIFWDSAGKRPSFGGLFSLELLDEEPAAARAASSATSGACSSNKRQLGHLGPGAALGPPVPASQLLDRVSLDKLAGVSGRLAVIGARVLGLVNPGTTLAPEDEQQVLRILGDIQHRLRTRQEPITLPCSFEALEVLERLARCITPGAQYAPGNLIKKVPGLMEANDLQDMALQFTQAMANCPVVKTHVDYLYTFWSGSEKRVTTMELGDFMNQLPVGVQEAAYRENAQGRPLKQQRTGLAASTGGSSSTWTSNLAGSMLSGKAASVSSDGLCAGSARDWAGVQKKMEGNKMPAHFFLQKLRNVYGHPTENAATITRFVRQAMPNYFVGMFRIAQDWVEDGPGAEPFPAELKGLRLRPLASDVFRRPNVAESLGPARPGSGTQC